MWNRLWHAFDGLARDTLWTGVHDVMGTVAAVVSFLLLQYTYSEDTAVYGAFVGLYGVVAPLGSLTFAGPGLALIQQRIRFNEDLNEIFRSFVSVALILGVATSGLAVYFGWLFIDLSMVEIILLVVSELFFNSMIFVCSMLVQAAVDYPAMIKVRMAVSVLKTAAVIGLYVAGVFTIRNLAIAYVALYGAYSLWLMFRLLPAVGYTVRFGRPSRRASRSSAVFAVPLAASSLQLDGDKVALNAYNFDAQAGLYGAAYRVVQLGSLPLRVIGQAAFHRFLADDADRDNYQLRRSGALTGFMLAVGIVTAGAIYLMLPLVEDYFLAGRYREATEIVPWLLLFLPLIALSGTPMNGLLGLGRATERAVVFTSAAVVAVVLYVTLIPGRGWQGAVMATLGSEAYLAVASWIVMVYYQRQADRLRSSQVRGVMAR